MSEQEKLINEIDQALAEQEESFRADEETREAINSRTKSVEEDDFDDFIEIDPWENVYRPRAKERRQRRRGEEIDLPYDETNTAPRPRQRVLEHRERKEAERWRKKSQKRRKKEEKENRAFTREALQNSVAREENAAKGSEEAEEHMSYLTEDEVKLSRRERRRQRYVREELEHADPCGREWLLFDEAEEAERIDEERDRLSKKRRKRKNRMRKRRRPGRIILLVIIILVAALVASAILLYFMGQKDLRESNISGIERTAPEGAAVSGNTIRYNGKTWKYNENLANVVIFGVGEDEDENGEPRNAATAMFLWSYDTERGTSNLIPLPTHLRFPCPVFDDNNQYLYMNDQYLGFAYTTGGTTELMRYQNVVNSVSNLFYGIPVSGYLAIDMEKVGKLNDLVGGVPVRVLEDLTEYDKDLIEGEQVSLQGDLVEPYVTKRCPAAKTAYDAETGLNERQVQYLNVFMSKIRTALLSPANFKTMLTDLREDTYSDLGLPHFIYLSASWIRSGFGDSEIVVPLNGAEEEAATAVAQTEAEEEAALSEEEADSEEDGQDASAEETADDTETDSDEEASEKTEQEAEITPSSTMKISTDEDALFDMVLKTFYQ